MKIEVKENKATISKEYPYLGVYKTFKSIVLFTEPNYGFCLSDDISTFKVGEYSNKWVEHMFTPFNGTVILSNT